MRRYIECNNVMLLIVDLEFFGVVAIVAVKDKQPIFTLRTRCYIEIEIPNPIYTFLISSLPVIGCYNALGGRKVALLIPIGEVVLPS